MKLILVYNANSGIKNSLLSSLHKILSPSSYPCDLCTLTHGNFSEIETWKNFRKSANLSMNFYHIDEFEDEFGKQNFKYPIALLYQNEKFLEVISVDTFKQIKNTQHLIECIQQLMYTHSKA